MNCSTSVYVGRFAPSPTGKLHFGSLTCALASYLDAKSNNGSWILRIENIDPPREQLGADQDIINCLAAHGLNWHNLVYQKDRMGLHAKAKDYLIDTNKTFSCCCSRAKQKAENNSCTGKCQTEETRSKPSAVYLRLHNPIENSLPSKPENEPNSNCMLWRKEDLPSYHLAVVVDDYQDKITHVVRGNDLLNSTAYQNLIQNALDIPAPQYFHHPIICAPNGKKLSKQTMATPVNPLKALDNLRICLQLLGQDVGPSRYVQEIIDAGINNWTIDAIPKKTFITLQ